MKVSITYFLLCSKRKNNQHGGKVPVVKGYSAALSYRYVHLRPESSELINYFHSQS